MKREKDSIQEFVSLRAELLKEKSQLAARLAEIDKVLGEPAVAVAPAAPRGRRPGRPAKVKAEAPAAPAAGKAAAKAPKAPKAAKGRVGRPKGGRRVKNTMSLKQAVTQVTKDKALSAQEIIAAVEGIGYQFATDNKLNSLRTLLYSDKSFKNDDGKFTCG